MIFFFFFASTLWSFHSNTQCFKSNGRTHLGISQIEKSTPFPRMKYRFQFNGMVQELLSIFSDLSAVTVIKINDGLLSLQFILKHLCKSESAEMKFMTWWQVRIEITLKSRTRKYLISRSQFYVSSMPPPS